MSNQQGNQKPQNPNRRFVGKKKTQNGQYGAFEKIYLDNPYPTNQDGTPNQFHKGMLLWCDAATGKKYLVKQLSLRGVSQDALNKGFTNSISIDLDNAYEVRPLD
jgi:hypothetical protein